MMNLIADVVAKHSIHEIENGAARIRRKDRYSLVLPWKIEERDTIPLKKTTSSSRRLNVNILESPVIRYECIGKSAAAASSSRDVLVSSRLSSLCLCPSLQEKRQELMRDITRNSYQRIFPTVLLIALPFPLHRSYSWYICAKYVSTEVVYCTGYTRESRQDNSEHNSTLEWDSRLQYVYLENGNFFANYVRAKIARTILP